MDEKNNVIPFVRKRERANYTPASITLDKDIVKLLEIMPFEERNRFLNEVLDFFFEYVQGDEDEIK
ncbi:MAG TPA: hypothetical protein VNM45_18265 [Bacillus sp. (in: firmicutes)]|nr:hypothetical protein [Bacillus sp. (in: firmicutes)]